MVYFLLERKGTIMYALVLIEYAVKSLDKTFIYKIPEHLLNKLVIGMKVLVPFGKNEINGFVLNITNTLEDNYEIKKIINIIDEELVVSSELLKIAEYLENSTLCTKITALETMLPTSLKVRGKNTNYNSYDAYIVLNKDKSFIENYINTNKLGKTQKEVLMSLLSTPKLLKNSFNPSTIKSLILKDLIVVESIQKYRINEETNTFKNFQLTHEQSIACTSVIENINTYNTFLLYGVTGSGKTEVYINLITEVLKQNKTAILLVPEISLTAQITRRFYNRFGSNVAIFHSALSVGEKNDEYLKILRGEVSIVIGTRSAIFAPLKNLGIIIIDEEHSSTYKQDNNPRYNALDIAAFRCKLNNIPLILGSATPTLESKSRADKGVFKLLTLKSRVGSAKLPLIHIVNMEEEMKKHNMIFSELLTKKIEERLNLNEQVILLLNRRGYSTFINCSNCGFTYKCPNCDISLTYHKTNNNLICHYCGFLIKKANLCPKCNEESLNYYGLGTEKLEEYINKTFKNAKVIRMDQDTTSKKGSHEKIIKSFMNEEYNILLGTQMISKGLDFPKVSLVGVINADTSLNIPDFRSNENTFSLLNQVAGRSGRSDILGEVVIQTFNPDNYIMKCVLNNNYDAFYNYEMNIRRRLKYPPYYYLVSLKVIGKVYESCLEEATKVKHYLNRFLNDETIVLGPTTAAIFKFNNEYRFQIIIKYRFDDKLKQVLKELDNIYIGNKNVRLEIDFNPTRI
ncbi:MAG: primosomal protein N' [Bacilli bacterium]